MRRLLILAAVLCSLAVAAPPTVDKAKLEAYLRYAEGFIEGVHFAIDDPVATQIPNFYRVVVHLTVDNGGGKQDRTYLMTQDGKEIVNGTVWDLDKSPFADTMAHLPDGGYAFGPADAKVKIVLFSDFQCPFCRQFAKTVRDNIPQKYPKDVRVVFEDFPLERIHPWARAAAEASHCVGDQNADTFWDYHDWIFEHAPEITTDNLKTKVVAWAADKKLDTEKLKACMDTRADSAVVEQSENRGKALLLQQTPTAFINGREIASALSWKDLETVVQIELKHATQPPTPVGSR